MSTIGRAFTNEGMVAVSADYRLVPGARWPAQRDDVAAAVAYLRKHAEELSILPGRIGAAGVSAGGHLSATLGVRHPKVPPISRVQAVGSISGIHDLAAPLTTDGNSFRIVENLLGEGGEPDLDARREGSPVTYVDANAAPTFFVVGGRDDLVPRAQAELMERRLRAAGVEAEILDIPTMGHVPDLDRPEDLRAMRELARWMRRQLTAPSR
jgi:acetyl esterase/lipase